MRNPKRIAPMLSLIRQVWEKHPDLRLAQLINSCRGEAVDAFYMEDEALEAALWKMLHGQ